MHSLKAYNFFKLDHCARSILIAHTEGELHSLLQASDEPIILGGGSNVLFAADIDKEVIVVDNKGIEIIEHLADSVIVRVAAGEVWHDFVMWTIDQNLGGIENLSLIPGKCGAAPIQNIGAYGVELSDVLEGVKCIEKGSGDNKTFTATECRLAYRESIFKNEWKDRYIITSITLRLTPAEYYRVNTSYGAIRRTLEASQIFQPTIKEVSDAVISIRNSKLPNPAHLPNAGSFFKNPVIPVKQFDRLKELHPTMPSYPVSDQEVKVPAGWLIDQCGWKGIMIGEVGVHARQALVIVNHGTTHGINILSLSRQIQTSVLTQFGINLTREVTLIQ